MAHTLIRRTPQAGRNIAPYGVNIGDLIMIAVQSGGEPNAALVFVAMRGRYRRGAGMNRRSVH